MALFKPFSNWKVFEDGLQSLRALRFQLKFEKPVQIYPSRAVPQLRKFGALLKDLAPHPSFSKM